MKYVIVGKNMEVSPSLEKAVKDKLGKLEKFFAEDTTAHVTLEVNHGRHINRETAQEVQEQDRQEAQSAGGLQERIFRGTLCFR